MAFPIRSVQLVILLSLTIPINAVAHLINPAVNKICNKEKAVPEEWITKDGSDIGDEFIAYARPLIQGSVEVPMKDGLPYFAFRK